MPILRPPRRPSRRTRPRIVAVVADSVTPELSVVRQPAGPAVRRRIAEQAFGRFEHLVGGDLGPPSQIAMVGLLEDVPLLLVHGEGDRTVPIRDGRRLAAAAPPGARHLVIAGADHGAGHATDPVAYEAAVEAMLQDAFTGSRR